MMVVSPAAILYDQNGNPVAVAPDVAIPAGTKTILVAGTDGTNARILSVDANGKLAITDGGGSLTVDGTVTANQGSPASLEDAWPVALTDGTNVMPTGDAAARAIFQKITDGTDTASVAAASSAAAAGDSALVVGLSPNSPLPSGTNYVGKTRLTDGSLDVSLLNSAPGSDTGQVAVPVRVISNVSGGSGTSSIFDQSFPTAGTAVGFTDGNSMQAARVFDVDSGVGGQFVIGTNLRISASGGSVEAAAGAGTTTAGTLRVVLPTDQTSIPVTDNGSSLTVDGTVTADQGAPAAFTDAWPVALTDGTNVMPTGDAAARAIFHKITDGTDTAAVAPASTAAVIGDPALVVAFSPNSALPTGSNSIGTVTAVQATASNLNALAAQGSAAALSGRWPVEVTDGTNTMPTADVAGRASFHKITDGTNTAAVKAASTAAQATDPSLVVAFSPNSELPAGTNEVGFVAQGTPAALSGRWPVQLTDGTNTMPTGDAVGRAVFQKITDGTDTAAVAAASTAAQASEPALVVGLSPNSPLPTGSNSIGTVTAVQATASNLNALVAQGSAAALSGHWPVQVTDGSNTMPTADVAGRASFHKVTDGTNTAAVKAASTAALATDPSLVVAFSPNSELPAGANEVGLVAQGTPAALADYWPVRHTDGTNTLPTADVAGRALFSKVTDGTNTQPTGDVAARAIYGYVTDGINTTAVKAASTAAVATDPSLVTAFSPNSPLPTGTNEVGAVKQGTAAALSGRWPVEITDGTNVMPTGDAVGRAVFHKVTDGTNTAAVKAASTAALATDPSLVVAFSPNSELPAGANEIGLIAQGTPAALADYWPVRHTDGTNTLPTADVTSRALFAKVTDGTNTQPTGDVAARAIYGYVTDGTNTTAVKAASTAALASDPSLVTAFSPNSPLPVGSNEVGAVAQGTPAALADYWPVRHTDGTNTLPTADVASRALFAKVTDGTNTMPTGDVVARSVFHQISDGTNGPVAVKPASTASVAADLSLVTAFSPNSPLPAGKNIVGGTRLYDYNSTPVRSTAGAELRISQLYALGEFNSRYELETYHWDVLTATGGTAAFNANKAAIDVQASSSSGSTAALRTNTYFKYQCGYSQLTGMTLIHTDTGQANQVREWGYYDDANGYFFKLNGTALSIVRRSSVSGSPVDTEYAQSSWTIDPLNGLGPSGVTLNVSKGNAYEIEAQCFGVGLMRFYINGILVHELRFLNELLVPAMQTISLPVQIRVNNTGESTAGGITLLTSRVVAQSQVLDPFSRTYATATSIPKLVGLTEVPVLSIRPKATFQSVTNRSWLLPVSARVATEGYKVRFRVLMNATLTGASWTSTGAQSTADFDTSASSFSGGETLYASFLPNDVDAETVDLEPYFAVFGRKLRNAGFAGSGANSPDSITIVATNAAVGNTDVTANVAWKEIRV